MLISIDKMHDIFWQFRSDLLVEISNEPEPSCLKGIMPVTVKSLLVSCSVIEFQ